MWVTPNDPRPQLVLSVLEQHWTPCTGIKFVHTRYLKQAHIRVAFGCEPPTDADIKFAAEEFWEQWRVGTYLPRQPSSWDEDWALDNLQSEYRNLGGPFQGKDYVGASWRKDSLAWSYVGTDAKNAPTTEPTLNLGFPEFVSRDLDNLKGAKAHWTHTVLHEFGHALGFEHENPHVVPYDEQAVMDYYRENCGWSTSTTKINVLKPAGCIVQGSVPDMNSIMSYHVPKHLLRQDVQRDEGPNGWQYWRRSPMDKLSATDQQWAARCYQ